MRLINHIMLRVTLSITIVLGIWAPMFYYIIVDEIEDETDDVLEDYSAMIIQNFLAGEAMPSNDNGSNNTYYLRSVPIDSLPIVKSVEGFSNENIYIKYKGEDEPARVLRQSFRDASDNYYEVTVITPTIDNQDFIEAILKLLFLLFLSLLFVILLFNAVAIHRGLNPLNNFLAWLHSSDIESCELPSIKQSNIREIKRLHSAIETFAERGRRAFTEQKEFIGNASHELQTPIAICQNRLELLLESGLNEQQVEDVAGCMTTLARLSKLNKSLLMLSRIDNGGFENQEVDINQVVRSNIELLKELNEHRNISLSIIESGSCIVSANRDLTTTLIVNLIKNSYSHNIDGGEIKIEIGTDFIRIGNSGIEKALDPQKIFNRFYQAESKGGTYGLGLSIVQSICKLYNFKIGYSFTSNLHLFEIKFK